MAFFETCGPNARSKKEPFYFMENLIERFVKLGFKREVFETIRHYPKERIEKYLIELEKGVNRG